MALNSTTDSGPSFPDLFSPPSDPWSSHSVSPLLLMLEGKQGGTLLCVSEILKPSQPQTQR